MFFAYLVFGKRNFRSKVEGIKFLKIGKKQIEMVLARTVESIPHAFYDETIYFNAHVIYCHENVIKSSYARLYDDAWRLL